MATFRDCRSSLILGEARVEVENRTAGGSTMRPIERLFHRFSKCKTRLFTLVLASQFRQIGKGTRIEPPFRFANIQEICLEDNVIIHRDSWLLVLGGLNGKSEPRMVIKSHAGIGMGATISAAEGVTIGEHALLARNVYISDNSHAFENVIDPIMLQGIDKPAPVSIGRHSWLGQNVCVLPGVTIGEHCVIGANSVVNRSIPDFSVAVGAPARVVKRYNRGSREWEKVS